MNIRIGGCEAIKDMFDAIALGSDRIIAPMVESAYALKKYLAAVNIVYPADPRPNVEFLITSRPSRPFATSRRCCNCPKSAGFDGIVIGRVNLTGSLGLTREDINNATILDLSMQAAALAKTKGLQSWSAAASPCIRSRSSAASAGTSRPLRDAQDRF